MQLQGGRAFGNLDLDSPSAKMDVSLPAVQMHPGPSLGRQSRNLAGLAGELGMWNMSNPTFSNGRDMPSAMRKLLAPGSCFFFWGK